MAEHKNTRIMNKYTTLPCYNSRFNVWMITGGVYGPMDLFSLIAATMNT